ncbi:1556_t:CDS:1, partial [Acaulospora morrowiae]
YELSKKEQKIGSPERPISDLGIKGYHSYWKRTILRILQSHTVGTLKRDSPTENVDDNENFMISINEISKKTSIRQDDVTNALREMSFLRYRNPKVDLGTINSAINHDDSGNDNLSTGGVERLIDQDNNRSNNQQTDMQRDEESTLHIHHHIICVSRRMVDNYIRNHGVRLDNRMFDICGLKWAPNVQNRNGSKIN